MSRLLGNFFFFYFIGLIFSNLGHSISMPITAESVTKGCKRKGRGAVELAGCMVGKFFKYFMLTMHIRSTDGRPDFFI